MINEDQAKKAGKKSKKKQDPEPQSDDSWEDVEEYIDEEKK